MKTKFLGFKAYKTQSQAFATFEYQKVQFEFFCDLDARSCLTTKWQLLEDRNIEHLSKIMNIQRLIDACAFQLKKLDCYLFERS